ncbi:MAG: exodeoxyribonuclease VII large subunit, partial [Caldilineaceae bacterium]
VEINRAWERLETLRSRLHRASPQRQIDLARQRLVEREERLHGQMAQRLTALKERLAFGQVRLESLNPTAVLGRGYSIVQNVDGAVVTGPAGAAVGDSLRVRGAGGEYNVRRE